ncbi:hypothetical protein FB451DRAFT_1450329 [Mycena latifolia]|nr:hypothetical protein FB451DRAFT_1450329 [Mycena latifolia]
MQHVRTPILAEHRTSILAGHRPPPAGWGIDIGHRAQSTAHADGRRAAGSEGTVCPMRTGGVRPQGKEGARCRPPETAAARASSALSVRRRLADTTRRRRAKGGARPARHRLLGSTTRKGAAALQDPALPEAASTDAARGWDGTDAARGWHGTDAAGDGTRHTAVTGQASARQTNSKEIARVKSDQKVVSTAGHPHVLGVGSSAAPTHPRTRRTARTQTRAAEAEEVEEEEERGEERGSYARLLFGFVLLFAAALVLRVAIVLGVGQHLAGPSRGGGRRFRSSRRKAGEGADVRDQFGMVGVTGDASPANSVFLRLPSHCLFLVFAYFLHDYGQGVVIKKIQISIRATVQASAHKLEPGPALSMPVELVRQMPIHIWLEWAPDNYRHSCLRLAPIRTDLETGITAKVLKDTAIQATSGLRAVRNDLVLSKFWRRGPKRAGGLLLVELPNLPAHFDLDDIAHHGSNCAPSHELRTFVSQWCWNHPSTYPTQAVIAVELRIDRSPSLDQTVLHTQTRIQANQVQVLHFTPLYLLQRPGTCYTLSPQSQLASARPSHLVECRTRTVRRSTVIYVLSPGDSASIGGTVILSRELQRTRERTRVIHTTEISARSGIFTWFKLWVCMPPLANIAPPMVLASES